MAKVLIVEDENILAINTRLLLEEMGHEVAGIAGRDSKALEIARSEKPDVALVDIVIKGDKSGVELAKLLSRDYGCAIIFMSGSPESITEEVRHMQFLGKPFGTEQLANAIEEALK